MRYKGFRFVVYVVFLFTVVCATGYYWWKEAWGEAVLCSIIIFLEAGHIIRDRKQVEK